MRLLPSTKLWFFVTNKASAPLCLPWRDRGLCHRVFLNDLNNALRFIGDAFQKVDIAQQAHGIL